MRHFLLTVAAGVLATGGLFGIPSLAAAQYPGHGAYHDALDHREFHRSLEHRDAHRYPMSWQQHGALHDQLRHERFHDRLEHRQFHRDYNASYQGYSPYGGYGSSYYQPSYEGYGYGGSSYQPSYGYSGSGFGIQGPRFSLYFGQ